MPDYEFHCRHCKKAFTAHMSIEEHDRQVPPCPRCGNAAEVDRMISLFNVKTSKKSAAHP